MSQSVILRPDENGNYPQVTLTDVNGNPISNTQGTLLASAMRTATTTSLNQINYNARGVLITLNITAASGTGGLTPQLLGIDPVSNNGYFITAAPTAITASGLYVYEIYPGASAAGVAGTQQVNQRTSASLPRTWYARVGHGDASSYTYSLGYTLIL